MNRKQKTVAGTIGALALMVFLALSLTIAPLASAGCGGVETSSAKKKVVPGRPPLAIGDSVMLLAIPNLARIGFKVNARGCRQFSEGISVIRHYKHQGRLPHLVVIGLGADWVITRQDIRRTLHILGPKRVLGLIVPREEGGGTSHDADVARSIWHFHRKHIMLLDWVRFSRGRGGWFQPDGLHLTYAGASAYTKLISKSLPYAKAGEFPNRSHFP
jgi:hypothetical protein